MAKIGRNICVNPLLIIIGPTASGKTALGLELAKKYNGEILSADSRQVYKYMNIGTGKDLENFQWGLDLVEPDQQFNVSDFVNYANKVLDDIWKRGKLPIIVGGTGLYIKELLIPSQTLHISPNQELRSRNYKLNELQQMLQEKDLEKWEKMNESDRKNPRRLIRAIEVAGQISSPPSTLHSDTLIVGLKAPLEFLYQRIDKRVEERLAMGMADERIKLSKYKLVNTIGYRNETPEEWKLAEHQYAKRQLDYMEKFLPQTVWFDITTKNWKDEVCLTIKNTLNI